MLPLTILVLSSCLILTTQATPPRHTADPLRWPRGQYALPMEDSVLACPSSSGVYFQIGYRIQDTETFIVPLIGGNKWSSPCHLRGPYGKLYTQMNFCTKVDTSIDPDYDWPAGEYCVYKKGGACPAGGSNITWLIREIWLLPLFYSALCGINYRLPNVTWIIAVDIYSVARVVKRRSNQDITLIRTSTIACSLY